MTFACRCAPCGYEFTQDFRPNPFPDRPNAVTPLRSTDRDIELPCPSCGCEAHVDAGATLRLGAPTKHDTPFEWCEKNLPDFRPVDTTSTGRSDSRRRGVGINRIGIGLPGARGGMDPGHRGGA